MNTDNARNASKRPWFTRRLEEWRKNKAQILFPNSHIQFFPSVILPDDVLKSLATWADLISDESDMTRFIDGFWSDMKIHSAEILDILKRGQAIDLAEGEMFEEWKRHNDIKKKRILVPLSNPAKTEFDERRNSWAIQRGYAMNVKRKTLKKTSDNDTTSDKENLGQEDGDNRLSLTSSGHQTEPFIRHAFSEIRASSLNATPKAHRAQTFINNSRDKPLQTPRRPSPELTSIASRELPDSRSGRKRRRPAYLDE